MLLDTKEAAKYLKLGRSTLHKLRQSGGGPAFSKLGTRVVYELTDLDEWAAARRCTSTADYAARQARRR